MKKRMISFLLLLGMAAAMLPTAYAQPAEVRDTAKVEPVTAMDTASGQNAAGTDTAFTDAATWEEVKAVLEASNGGNVRLTADINISISDGTNNMYEVEVVGSHVLDLNGHLLNINRNSKSTVIESTLMAIKPSAALEIKDSSGNNSGRISYDAFLYGIGKKDGCELSELYVRNLFKVDAGATLELSGGSFSAGRAKLSKAPSTTSFDNYYRVVSGSIVGNHSAGTVVIYGGEFEACGVQSIYMFDNDDCSITVYGGHFQSNAVIMFANPNHLTIYSGNFEFHDMFFYDMDDTKVEIKSGDEYVLDYKYSAGGGIFKYLEKLENPSVFGNNSENRTVVLNGKTYTGKSDNGYADFLKKHQIVSLEVIPVSGYQGRITGNFSNMSDKLVLTYENGSYIQYDTGSAPKYYTREVTWRIEEFVNGEPVSYGIYTTDDLTVTGPELMSSDVDWYFADGEPYTDYTWIEGSRYSVSCTTTETFPASNVITRSNPNLNAELSYYTAHTVTVEILGNNPGTVEVDPFGYPGQKMSVTVADNEPYSKCVSITADGAVLYKESEKGYTQYTFVMGYRDVKITARYAPVTNTITYYRYPYGTANNEVWATQTKNGGQSVTILPYHNELYRVGYTFLGWTISTGKSTYAPKATYDRNADMELYPVYRVNTGTTAVSVAGFTAPKIGEKLGDTVISGDTDIYTIGAEWFKVGTNGNLISADNWYGTFEAGSKYVLAITMTVRNLADTFTEENGFKANTVFAINGETSMVDTTTRKPVISIYNDNGQQWCDKVVFYSKEYTPAVNQLKSLNVFALPPQTGAVPGGSNPTSDNRLANSSLATIASSEWTPDDAVVTAGVRYTETLTLTAKESMQFTANTRFVNAGTDEWTVLSVTDTTAVIAYTYDTVLNPGAWYQVTVHNGSAYASSYAAGQNVSVFVIPESNRIFDHWEAEGITLTEAQRTAESFTLIMPENDITLTAVIHICEEQLSRIEATCTEDGYVVYACKDADCDVTITEILPKGHIMEFIPQRDGTCSVKGCLWDTYHCLRCDKCFSDPEGLQTMSNPGLGYDTDVHVHTSLKAIDAISCGYVCTDCGKVITSQYHSFVFGENDEDPYCSNCGYELYLLPGDVNLDGIVNSADLAILARHISNTSPITNEIALVNADFNNSGTITGIDLIALAKLAANIG